MPMSDSILRYLSCSPAQKSVGFAHRFSWFYRTFECCKFVGAVMERLWLQLNSGWIVCGESIIYSFLPTVSCSSSLKFGQMPKRPFVEKCLAPGVMLLIRNSHSRLPDAVVISAAVACSTKDLWNMWSAMHISWWSKWWEQKRAELGRVWLTHENSLSPRPSERELYSLKFFKCLGINTMTITVF